MDAYSFAIWKIKNKDVWQIKVKYEDQDKTYTGITDVRVRRKFDGEFEGGVGYGKSIEEALEDTIGWFLQVVDMDYPIADYPDGLTENDIEYVGYSDF